MEDESPEQEDAGWDDLDCHRDSPTRHRGVVHVLVDSVINPEAHQAADLV